MKTREKIILVLKISVRTIINFAMFTAWYLLFRLLLNLF